MNKSCLVINIVIMFSMLFLFCTKIKQTEVGQFIYVEGINTIHIDRECVSNMREIEFIDTCVLTRYTEYNFNVLEYKFCPRCVDDEAYKHLSKIISQNEKQAE